MRQAFLDCDGDALLMHVEQSGPACHTNRPNCFYIAVDNQGGKIVSEPR
ncbi:MAG: phosphoribosyl-AMP cyclohydrolase [Natronospirillum sp.]